MSTDTFLLSVELFAFYFLLYSLIVNEHRSSNTSAIQLQTQETNPDLKVSTEFLGNSPSRTDAPVVESEWESIINTDSWVTSGIPIDEKENISTTMTIDSELITTDDIVHLSVSKLRRIAKTFTGDSKITGASKMTRDTLIEILISKSITRTQLTALTA